MRVLFATSEAFPLIKTGGLADVSGALPKAISQLKQFSGDIRILINGVRHDNKWIINGVRHDYLHH